MFDKNLNSFLQSKDSILDEIIFSIYRNFEDKRKSKKGITPSAIKAEKKVLGQLINSLYQSYYSLPKSWVYFSLRTKSFTGKSSYRVFKRIFDYLNLNDYIKVKLGVEIKRKSTRIFPSKKLIIKFKSIGLVWRKYENDKQNGIILRDKIKIDNKYKKITVKTPNNSLVKKYQDNLNKINQSLLKHCVCIDIKDNDLLVLEEELKKGYYKEKSKYFWKEQVHHSLNFSHVTLKRIFSKNNLRLHGRFYGGWWQSLPGKYRPHITIDGYKTSECDYSTMSLRLLYAKENIIIDDDVDLYNLGHQHSKQQRDLVKTYVNAIINDENNRFRLSKDELKVLNMSHQQLKDAVNKTHSKISKYFGTGIGLELMYLDSVIAEDVMLSLLYEGVVVLPIHDSFIVRYGYEPSLKAQMKSSFKKIIKAIINVKATGPLLPEHFNKNIDVLSESKKHNIIAGKDTWELLIDTSNSIHEKYLSSWSKYQ